MTTRAPAVLIKNKLERNLKKRKIFRLLHPPLEKFGVVTYVRWSGCWHKERQEGGKASEEEGHFRQSPFFLRHLLSFQAWDKRDYLGQHSLQYHNVPFMYYFHSVISITGFWKLQPVKVNRQPVCPWHVRIERKIQNILAGGDVGMSKRTV